MLLTPVRYVLLAAITVLLTACGDSGLGDSELDKKSAEALYREATQQLYAQNAQFNFTAHIALDTEAENPTFSQLNIKVSGAVNNISQRYELIPEITAAVFTIKLPVLIDRKSQEVLLNTSQLIDAALILMPQTKDKLLLYKNKFIRLRSNNFKPNESHMAQAITIASEAAVIDSGTLHELFNSVPKASIQKLELDDKAGQIDAQAVLKITLDQQQSKRLQKHISTYIYHQVAANKELSEDCKKELIQTLLAADHNSDYQSSESVIYLNKQGQIMHERNVFNYDIAGEKISVRMIIDYSNYHNASFRIHPRKDQILEFTEENMRALQPMSSYRALKAAKQ